MGGGEGGLQPRADPGKLEDSVKGVFGDAQTTPSKETNVLQIGNCSEREARKGKVGWKEGRKGSWQLEDVCGTGQNK